MSEADDALIRFYERRAAAQPSGPKESSWGDHGRNLAAAGYGVVSSLAGAAQHFTGAEEDSIPARVRRWADEGAQSQYDQMSPEALRNLSAGVLPDAGPDIWDPDVDVSSAIGSKVIASIPYLIGGIAGGVAGGAIGGPLGVAGGAAVGSGLTAGAMTSGDLFNEFQSIVLEAPLEEMQKDPFYRELVAAGFTDEEARRRIVEKAAGNKPLIMGMMTALLAPLGAEAAAARGISRAKGAAGKTLRQRAVGTAIGEGVTETAEEATAEGLKQRGEMDIGRRDAMDAYQIAQKGVTGGVVGAITGAGIGAAFGPRYRPEVTPPSGLSADQQQALDPTQAETPPPETPVDPTARTPMSFTTREPPPGSVNDPGSAGSANTNINPGSTPPPGWSQPSQPPITTREPPPEAANRDAPSTPPPGAGLEEIRRRIDARRGLNAQEPPPEAANRNISPPTVTIVARNEPVTTRSNEAVDAVPDPTETPVEPPAPVETPTPTSRRRGRKASPPTPAEPVEMAGREEDYPQVPYVNPVDPRNRPLMEEGGTREPPVAANDETPVQKVMKKVRRGPKGKVAENAEARDIQGAVPAPGPLAALQGTPQAGGPPTPANDTERKPVVLPDLQAEKKLRDATLEDVARYLKDSGIETPEDLERRDQPTKLRTSKAEVARIAKGEAVSVTMPQTVEELENPNGRRVYRTLVDRIVEQAGKENVTPPNWAVAASEEFKARGKASKGPVYEKSKLRIQATWEMAREWMEQAANKERQVGKDGSRKMSAERAKRDVETIRKAVDGTPLPAVRDADLVEKMKEYAKEAVAKAKEIRITQSVRRALGEDVEGEPQTDADREDADVDYSGGPLEWEARVRHLRDLRDLASGEIKSKNRIRDIFANDLMIRNGQFDELITTARVESDAANKPAGYDDARKGDDTDTKVDDADTQEENDAVSSEDEVITDQPGDIETDFDTDDVTSEGNLVSGDRASRIQQQVQRLAKQEPKDAPAEPGSKRARVIEMAKRYSQSKPEPEPDPEPEPPKGGKKRLPKKVQDKVDTAKKLKGKKGDGPVRMKRGPGGDRSNPTEAMKEAGNYRKEKVKLPGLEISVETPAGEQRSGVSPTGVPWSVRMPVDYGYILQSRGTDGDHVDVYLGPEARGAFVREHPVYVFNQYDLDTGRFDEHKVMVGFESIEQALTAYTKSFSDGRGLDRVQSYSQYSWGEFQAWVRDRRQTTDPTDQNIIAAMTATGEVEMTMADVLALAGARDPASRIGASVDHVLERMRKALPDTRVVFMDNDALMKNVVASFANHPKFDRMLTNPPLGWYDPKTDTIYLQAGQMQDRTTMTQLLAHEGLHALYHNVIDRSPREARALLSMLERVRAQLIAEAKLAGVDEVQMPYGLDDIHEFLSEAFSDPQFQAILARVPAKASDMAGVKRSVWDTLIDRLLTFLKRFKGQYEPSFSMLDAIVRIEGSLWENRTPGGNDPPSRTAARMKFGSGEVISIARDQGAAANSKFWRWVRRGATLDQLRQASVRAKLFVKGAVDHMDNLVRAAQRAYEYQKLLRLQGEENATRFAEFAKRNAKEAAEIGDVMLELSRLNANPSLDPDANKHLKGPKAAQARKALSGPNGLVARYNALTPQGKQQFQAIRKYFGDTQQQMVEGTLRNLLEDGTTLSKTQVDDIVTKLMNNTFSEADATLINSEPLVGALKNAANVGLMKGVYFPFMRHGNFVVTTHKGIQNLMGGTLLGKDTVAFTGTDRAAVLAQADAFAENVYDKQQLTVSAVQVAYFDGKKQITRKDAESLGTPYTVQARVVVQTRGLHTFENEAAAFEFIRSSTADGSYSKPGDYIDKAPMLRDEFFNGPELTTKGVASIMRQIDKNDELTPSQKNALKQSMRDASIMMLSGYQVQHSLIRRRNVLGYSEDVVRSIADYADMSARTLTKLKFRPGMNADLEAMRLMAQDRTAKDTLRAERTGMLQEVEARINAGDFSPQEPGKVVQALMQLSMFDKLFSPAYSVINMMQVAMVTYPYLAGQYGAARTAGAIQRAYADIGLSDAVVDGVVNTARAVKGWNQIRLLNTRDVFGDIKKSLNNPAEAKMIDAMLERGGMGNNVGFEVAHPEMHGVGWFGRTVSKVDRIARQMPLIVEDINRTVTALATYRLALADGKSVEQATDMAFDAIMKTQGDYRGFNAAPIFNHPLMRPALQFKKYAQLMTALVGDMAYQSFKGATAKERRIAQKQLMNLVGVQVLMAGTLSLPGIEIAKAAFLLSAALGFGEGWEQRERQLRKLHDEAMGNTWGELVSRGVLSRAIGLDLSTRLALSDMWVPFGEPKTYDAEGLLGYAAKFFAGAPGSLVLDWGTALRLGAEGKFDEAAIKGFPVKFVSDFQTAYRDWSKGDSTVAEAPLKAFGFRSARQAEEAEARGERIDRNKTLARDYSRLSKAYRDATTGHERARVMIEINRHNATAPLRYKVFPSALDKGRKQDEERRRALQGG